MPREITDKEAILSGLKSLKLTSELFIEANGKLKNQNDLDVIVQGKPNASTGKRVGPYVRMLTYESGEIIMRQGEWGGNTFYLFLAGMLDVYIREPGGEQRKISRLPPGTCFGEMAVLAGVERNATIMVPLHATATVLEVTRPALRLLRKLEKFSLMLDEMYRSHGLGRVLADLIEEGTTSNEAIIQKLREIGMFKIYAKHHVLCQETEPIETIILIKSGWVRRVRGVPLDPASTGVAVGMGQTIGVDFLGAGNCLGLDGSDGNKTWKYSASAMARTEVLEIPIARLAADPQLHDQADPQLRDQIVAAFAAFSTADDNPPSIEAVEDLRAMASAEAEITTGIVDGANLLVMDMDLCVRCGNCSLACHKVHGQSRLLRRGISITRPVRIGSERTQHLLSPQVCMHCKDPECLTGCPTGSIFRDPRGYVDIDPATCIGCFDCATQCPYDAISMVPRNGAPAGTFDLLGTLRKTFSLSTPPAAPLQLTPGEDLVAIKCNLCEHTPLNPQGAQRQAYSCEENCPTGALLRVDPVKYFTEVENTQGLIFRDQTQAFGRNIHTRDPLAKALHISGGALILLAAVAAIGGLAARGFDGVLWGTWLTMRWVTGLTGLFGIAAVMTYPLRKQIYRRRAGALRYWMLMHVYVGALAGLILMLHAGSHTGGLLTTALYLAFDAVIVSGLFGIASYIVAPRIMTSIEGEPLLIEDLVARRAELRREFDEIAKQSEGWLKEEIEKQVVRKFLSFSFLMRQFMRREQLTSLLANARRAFRDRLTRLATSEERTQLLRAVETAVTLRRVDALIYLHKTLKLWVAPHVISTSVMLALLVVHVIQVVYFAVK